MTEKISLEIITPSSIAYQGEADIVTLPGAKSPFQVLKNHAPVVTGLEKGKLKIRDGGTETIFNTTNGFAEVNKNIISVLVESAEKE